MDSTMGELSGVAAGCKFSTIAPVDFIRLISEVDASF
jgi:hypothetical protein